ncbi:MAG: hypothetical protein E2O41_04925 [Nitrospina sp.]|nr:MAG: hypothetical protein E2O41_04925 [Nitrospina sp.]
MSDKNDNPESNPDASQPNPAEDTASASGQENVDAGSASEDLSPPENLATNPAGPDSPPTPRKSFSLAPLLLILVLATVGGGAYWIHGEQKNLRQEVQVGFNQMTSRLDTVEADLQRLQQNQQQLATFNSSLQGHQSEVAETFKSHQNSLSTLDEDVIRLTEELRHLAATQAAQAAADGDRAGLNGSDSVLRSTLAGSTAKPEPATSPAMGQMKMAAGEQNEEPVGLAEGPAGDPTPATLALAAGDNSQRPPEEAELTDSERSQEAQEYLDFVESTTGKFFRLVKEGLINMWHWFASLFA